jgi:hypothetical protein
MIRVTLSIAPQRQPFARRDVITVSTRRVDTFARA